MTPIFSRIWLIKISDVRDFETVPVSLRNACDMRRACKPMCESPISPSSSALGTYAATESTTRTSMAPERTRASVISIACSPESGCETSRLSTSTPSFLAYPGSSACSASTNAAMPPIFCASAITCSVIVVLPEDSGPKTSTTRPRGKPPTPKAASKEIAPVGITAIGTIASFDPSRMIEPLPNCFSICAKAKSIAFARSSAISDGSFCDARNEFRPNYTRASKRIKSEFDDNRWKCSQIGDRRCTAGGNRGTSSAPPKNDPCSIGRKHETIAPLNALYQCTTHEGRDLHFVVRCIDDRAGALPTLNATRRCCAMTRHSESAHKGENHARIIHDGRRTSRHPQTGEYSVRTGVDRQSARRFDRR